MNYINNNIKAISLYKIILFISLLVVPSISLAQVNPEAFKVQAVSQMQNGRYGEAIDLLNHYVAAFPQRPDGYHLLGLCYEKREQYDLSVYDLKTALKLAPNDNKIAQDLARVTKIWYDFLNNKIEGHKREIAIDPSKPVNYLEIGKCYSYLGNFPLAEQWYDEYLKREEPSPDEVIRYTLILQKTGHIEKGEKILKKFVDKFPNDHRLWSRYGYFTLWLGKTKIAIDAFQNALALRPYFQEAQDGLNIALGKQYVYSINDTSYRPEKQAPRPPEYPIDRYYRILKTKPTDDETRFLLVDELIKANRLEEAYQQLNILSTNHKGEARFDEKWASVTAYRDSTYSTNIEQFKKELDADPKNKEALIKYAEYCANLERFDDALAAYDNYFNMFPDEQDNDLRFRYAQLSAWNKNFQVANEQVNIILEKEPDNLKYQLLASQLYVWQGTDFDKAKEYLTNILAKEPNNFEALIAMGSAEIHYKNFDAAQQDVDLANTIQPGDNAVTTLQSRIDFEKLRAEEERLFAILEEGRKLALDGKCQDALAKYDEYISKSEPNRSVQREYADVKACAGDYSGAISIYNDLLTQQYDSLTDIQRAKVYYWMGDSLNSLTEFKRLDTTYKDNFDVHLYLGDSYTKMHQYSDARRTYDDLLTTTTDTAQISMIQQRINWLPVTGLNGLFATFPSYIILYPDVYAFNDNLGYVYNLQSLRIELGALNFLSLGLYGGRGAYKSNNTTIYFSDLKGGLYFKIKNVNVGLDLGKKYYRDNTSISISDGFIKTAGKDSLYSVSLYYLNTDANEVLYSANLVDWDTYQINSHLTTTLYQFSGFYQLKSKLKISALYNYIKVSDGNVGETFEGKLGKYFDTDLIAGYEFDYTKFQWEATGSLFGANTSIYYSPSNYQAHCLWLDWTAVIESDFSLVLGGKAGIIPADDFLLTEAHFSLKWKILDNFALYAVGTVTNTVREIVGYNSHAINVSAVWQVY
jgi:predicted Zn-dependent protease